MARREELPRDAVSRISKRLARKKVAGMTAADLLAADFPPVRKVCGDFIQEGVTILASSPKSGKTTLMRQAGEAVGIGCRFLEQTCERGDVLFLSLEEGARLFRRKLQAMNMDSAAAKAIDLHFDWPRGLDGCARLSEYLREQEGRIRLVVLDSLTRFRPQVADRNITQFQADYDVVAALSSIAKAFPGLAIVVIHHTRKIRSVDPIDDISGTLGLAAAADAYLVMRKEGRGATLHAGGRLWDRDDSDFNLSRDGFRWHLTGISDGLTDKERAVLAMVRDRGGMGPTDLAGALNVSRQTAFGYLDNLCAKAKVQKDRGFYIALPINQS